VTSLSVPQRLVVVVVVVVVQYNNKHGTSAYCRSVRHLAEATENITKFYEWQLGVGTLYFLDAVVGTKSMLVIFTLSQSTKTDKLHNYTLLSFNFRSVRKLSL